MSYEPAPYINWNDPDLMAAEMIARVEAAEEADKSTGKTKPPGLTIEAIKEACKLLEDKKVPGPYRIEL